VVVVFVAEAQHYSRDGRKLSVRAFKVAINKHLQANVVDFAKCRCDGLHFSSVSLYIVASKWLKWMIMMFTSLTSSP